MERPRLAIPLDGVDRILNLSCIALIIFQGVVSIYYYTILPETIPIHFNMNGEPNGYGSKVGILFLPVFSLVVFLALSKLNQYPHTFNYPVSVTVDNAKRQYSLAQKLMRWTNLSLILISLLVLVFIVYSAEIGVAPSSVLLIVVITALALLPAVVYLYLAYNNS